MLEARPVPRTPSPRPSTSTLPSPSTVLRINAAVIGTWAVAVI